MKTIIICASTHHGNTRKVADAIAAECGAEVIDALNVKEKDLSGCFDSVEAITIAKQAGIGVLIPGHFDLYNCNMVNPAYFVDCIQRIAPGQKYHIFQPGERYILQK